MSRAVNVIFKLLQLCGGTRKFSGVDGYVLHLIPAGCLSECPWTIPRNNCIVTNFNFYFHQVFYAGESENQGL
jgi:hypothetical protein